MKKIDPRFIQMTTQILLLTFLYFKSDFFPEWTIIAIYILTALSLQFLCDTFLQRDYNYKSAFISSLSLCLLVKTHLWYIALIISFLTILNKFIFTNKIKHYFNPTNFSIVLALLFLPGVWVSPGLWGHEYFLILMVFILGILVTYLANRLSLVLAFLTIFISLRFARLTWLGDPLAILIHSLENGSFFIFVFFMLSDPKTSPSSQKAMWLFVFMVNLFTYYFEFFKFMKSAVFYGLFTTSFVFMLYDLIVNLWRKNEKKYTVTVPS